MVVSVWNALRVSVSMVVWRMWRWRQRRRWWRLCMGWWTPTPHLLDLVVHNHYSVLHGLYVLHPLLLLLLMLLIQLHVPPIRLIELLPHWFIQCMHPITNIHHIGPSKPSFTHRRWRIRHAIGNPHIINPTLVAIANHLGPYLIVIDS